MRNFVLRLLINAVALYVAAHLIVGVRAGGWIDLLTIALVFGVVNATIRPLLRFLTCPLILLTLGLFTLVINGLMLQLTSWFGGWFGIDFQVDGFWPAFWGALVVSLVSCLLSMVFGDAAEESKKKRKKD